MYFREVGDGTTHWEQLMGVSQQETSRRVPKSP